MNIDDFIECKRIVRVAEDVRVSSLKECVVPGAIMEFGVYRGHSIIRLANKIPNNIGIFGFDSFKGLPEDWVISDEVTAKAGHFKCIKPEVPNNVKLIDGWFDDTIPKWLYEYNNDIAYIHIDCDLFSSTKTVLTLLNERIVPGTVIVFDDLYNWQHPEKFTKWRKSEWRAMQQWIRENKRKVDILMRSEHGCAASVIVKK